MNSTKDLSEYPQAELEELALVIAIPKGAANLTTSTTASEGSSCEGNAVRRSR